jgi:hypothetical protein
MNDSLYSLNVFVDKKIECSEWLRNDSLSHPTTGLFDYGLEITEKGKLVLFGGVTNSSKITRRNVTYILYNSLWIWDFNDLLPHFQEFVWMDGGAGYTKIISMGGELVCVMNNNMLKNQIVLLDIQHMKSFALKNFDQLNGYRTGFDVVPIDQRNLLVIGGFVIHETKVQELEDFNILSMASLSYVDATSLNFGVLGLFLVIPAILIILFRKLKQNLGQNNQRELLGSIGNNNVHVTSKTIEMESSEKRYVNGQNIQMPITVSAKVKESGEILDIEETIDQTTSNSEKRATITINTDTKTLAVDYPGIYIPGFKFFKLEENFELKGLIASGGFGDVYKADIINEDIKNNYNNGIKECVVKHSKTKMPSAYFIQELSMHELFGKNKYFAKLICFSENPQTLVLKFYKYGTLRTFIFPSLKKKNQIPLEYSLELVIFMSTKITWAIHFMHQKGVIHNDIKPENILLDGDEMEPLFPVISDFGIVRILENADLIPGFLITEIRACTSLYAAPELLASMNNNLERLSNPKTDTYSVGIVLYELFSRHDVRKLINKDRLLDGELPRLSFEKIMEQWKSFHISNKILNLLIDCVDSDPNYRSSLDVVSGLLKELNNIIKKSESGKFSTPDTSRNRIDLVGSLANLNPDS